MTIVDALLRRLAAERSERLTLQQGKYLLEVAAGRPGSVCLALHEQIEPGVRVVLAEGFSLNGQVVYDQRDLSDAEIDRILTSLLPAPTQPVAVNTTPTVISDSQMAIFD